ncbi:MAG: PD-(D/E)XK nuclease family protein [Oscillospiraceae bacterium]|nr:PD-(D/E)XK nuclease family protein [Oscillospiraceae bacterium]
MLRLVLGRAGSGKSHFCHEEVASLCGRDDLPLILLVPEQYTLEAERRLIKHVGMGGIMQAEVVSFSGLAERAAASLGGTRVSPMDGAGKAMALTHVMTGCAGRLKVLGNRQAGPGMVSSLSDAIGELKRGGADSERLSLAIGRMDAEGREGDASAGKLADLALVMAGYESFLAERGLRDGDDALTALCSLMHEYDHIVGARIWVDGFASFTGRELEFIGKALSYAHSVTVTLCLDEGGAASEDEYGLFRATAATFGALRAMARQGGGEAAVIALPEDGGVPHRFRSSSALAHLEAYAFAYPAEPYGGANDAVAVMECGDAYDEVAQVAKAASAMAMRGGLSYGDMAVVCRDLSMYRHIIPAVFGKYGIPAFMDARRPVAGHPIAMAISSAVDVAVGGFAANAVLDYVKAGYSGISQDDADLLENHALAHGINGRGWTSSRIWSRSLGVSPVRTDVMDPDGDDACPEPAGAEEGAGLGQGREGAAADRAGLSPARARRLSEARLKVVRPLMRLRSKVRGRQTPKAFCSALYGFVTEIGLPEAVAPTLGDDRPEDAESALEGAQVYGCAIGFMDRLVELFEGRVAEGAGFYRDMLRMAFGAMTAGVIPASTHMVSVGEIRRTRVTDLKALFVLGVNEGVFPAVHKEGGLLADADRRRLAEAGVALEGDSRAKAFEERFLAYATLCLPKERLVLSYHTLGTDGSPKAPSHIVAAIRGAFGPCPPPRPGRDAGTGTYGAMLDGEYYVSTPPTAADAYARLRSEMARGPGAPIRVRALHEALYRRSMADARLSGRLGAVAAFGAPLGYTAGKAGISPRNARRLFGDVLSASVSSVEDYASCPYRFFASKGLRLKERDVYSVTLPELGIILHDLIDGFVKAMRADGLDWDAVGPGYADGVLREVADGLLASRGGKAIASTATGLWVTERIREAALRSVDAICGQMRRGRFRQTDSEVTYGEGGDYPPLVIKAGGRTVSLSGRIDRIDRMAGDDGSTYIRVIDYKSGAAGFDLSEACAGMRLQLPIYLLAALTNNPGALPAAVLYFKAHDPVTDCGDSMPRMGADDGAGFRLEGKAAERRRAETRMSGLDCDEPEIILAMDQDAVGQRMSLPAYVRKDGAAPMGDAVPRGHLLNLCSYAASAVSKAALGIYGGEFGATPMRDKGRTACGNCPYPTLCGFVPPPDGDGAYRDVRRMGRAEAWDRINAHLGAGGGESDE